MSEGSHVDTAQSLLSLDDDRITDNVLEYVSRIVNLQENLASIQQDLAEIDLSITGYKTQTKLNKINKRYQRVSGNIDDIYKMMTTKKLEILDGISNTDARDENIMDICIRNGDIPDEVKRLKETLSSVGQQLNSKIIAANSRLGMTISVLASGMALISIIVTLFA
jgi:DNA anti-recombination protein RmuC